MKLSSALLRARIKLLQNNRLGMALAMTVRFWRKFGFRPHLFRPRTFNEHICHKILCDRNPLLTTFADKFAVRAYVERILGAEGRHLPRLYAAFEDPHEIEAFAFPEEFVVKPSHLSGVVQFYRRGAVPDRGALVAQGSQWLSTNYFEALGEWAYKNIPPRILVEELLNPNGAPPADIKFYCFHGEPRFIQLDVARFSKHRLAFLDMDWKPLPLRYVYDRPEEVPPRPAQWEELVRVARALSKEVDFVRVDLYDLGDRVVVGELTNYPGAGVGSLDPKEWDFRLGEFWTPRGSL